MSQSQYVKIFSPYGAFGAISYIAVKDNAAVMIDAAGNNAEVFRYLDENNIKLEKILLTHGHTDHIAGLAEAAARSGAKVCISREDRPLLSDSYLNLSEYFGMPPAAEYSGEVTEVGDGSVIDFHGEEIKVVSVPGHTKGSVLYNLGDIIFSGDTLFRDSVGRTDMPGGDRLELTKSLEKMKSLFGNGEYQVLSGHTPPTTMAHEIAENPFFRGIGA